MTDQLVGNKYNIVDNSQFTLLKVLGEGAFGKVFLVQKVEGNDKGALFAMKVQKKAELSLQQRNHINRERDILATLNHPFIVKLKYTFLTGGKLCLILDFHRGGDLFSQLTKKIMFTENETKFYLAELSLALGYLHAIGVIHRDLKLENLLLDDQGHIVLTDFGLSKILSDGEKAYNCCGTEEYMAPEVVSGEGYSHAADWWSFGVLMFVMLTGRFPFKGNDRRDVMDQILQAKLVLPTNISVQARNLLQALLEQNTAKRIAAGPRGLMELKTHDFFDTINFDNLLDKKIRPPFQPAVDAPADAELTTKTLRDDAGIAASASANKLFRRFSFVTPGLQEDEALVNRREVTLKSIPPLTRKFLNDFVVINTIKTGNFNVFMLARDKTNGGQYLVKMIDKSKCDCQDEVEIFLKYSHHPGILTLRTLYVEAENVYLILDLIQGPDLLSYMCTKGHLTEEHGATILRTLANTVANFHHKGVVLRNLKPDNICFPFKDCAPETVTICDFTVAKQLRIDDGIVAPEVLLIQKYSASCDIWSLGLILYLMISGRLPFTTGYGDSQQNVMQNISSGNLDLNNGQWAHVSLEAKLLVADMLSIIPERRPTAAQLLYHPWLVTRTASWYQAYN